ncbi:MAG: TVP38/TMEM64 family protein [Chloroflexota bacterium]|nr:TVP38/TMEM64 family protein [Chloroflexota bacterium]
MRTQFKQRWTNVVLVVFILGVFAVTAWYYFSQYDEFSRENLWAFIGRFGAWAPLAYAAIYIISSPIPFLAPVLGAVGGLSFGAGLGTLYTIIIATVSALVPFTLAQRLGREWVKSKLRGRKLDVAYQQSGGSKGFLFILLMRLIPVLPWEVQNYVVGLTKVPLPTFVLATMLGIIPGTFAFTLLGSSAGEDTASWQFIIALVLVVLMMVVVPVVATYIRRRGDG